MTDFWEDFNPLVEAVAAVLDARREEDNAALNKAVAAFDTAARDYCGPARVRWHTVDRPPVSGAAVRRKNEIVREGDEAHSISYWEAEIVAGGRMDIG